MEDTSRDSDIFGQPLVNQPGEKWEYGVSMDWVGRLIERVTALSLGAYFEQNICGPLKMRKTTFCPTAEMKANLAFLHERRADGRLQLRENGHLLSRPLRVSSEEEAKSILHSGGAGLFSTPSDCCRMYPTASAALITAADRNAAQRSLPRFSITAHIQGPATNSLGAKPSMVDTESYKQYFVTGC